MAVDLVKMSPKGQLVVPQEIREELNFKPSDRFIPFPVKDGVMFKKMEMPDLKAEFNSMAKSIQKKFKDSSISKKDVSEAVKWARR